jgi:peroxin-1
MYPQPICPQLTATFPASGLLITGKTGTGKTSVAKAVASMLHLDLRAHASNVLPLVQTPILNSWLALTGTHFVDCSKLTEKPVSTLKILFQYWFDLCTFHRPTVLVLDNLDKLLPAEQEVRMRVVHDSL